MQRDTEKQQKFFFLLYIYKEGKKQFTSIVDNDETKKERLASLFAVVLC